MRISEDAFSVIRDGGEVGLPAAGAEGIEVGNVFDFADLVVLFLGRNGEDVISGLVHDLNDG